MVTGDIYGVEYLIFATNTKMLGKRVVFGLYVRPLWGSDGAPKVGDGRIVNPS